MHKDETDKKQLVDVMTQASVFAVPRPYDDPQGAHRKIWEDMPYSTLQEMMETFLQEGSVKIVDDKYKVNFAVIEKDSELSKVMTAFIDFFTPQAFFAEMEFREKIEMPTTENRILVLDDLEGTLKARNIIE